MTSANMMMSDMAQATSQFGVRRCLSLTLEAIRYKTGRSAGFDFQQNEALVEEEHCTVFAVGSAKRFGLSYENPANPYAA
ncbi:MAG: hypothetical protein ACLPX7_21685 [Xanthobacteraceae bacterium]